MRNIKLRYVNCNTAKEHLACVQNTWLYPKERELCAKLSKSNMSDEFCERFLSKLEKTISKRADFCLSWY